MRGPFTKDVPTESRLLWLKEMRLLLRNAVVVSRAPQAVKGQVQEEELDSCRAAGERRPEPSGMWVQGETEAVSSSAILRAEVCWNSKWT